MHAHIAQQPRGIWGHASIGKFCPSESDSGPTEDIQSLTLPAETRDT